LAESFRVLRKGKYLILFERVHPENISDDDIEKMLNQIKAPERMKKRLGVSSEVTITRRMLGEHEYRASDWFSYLFKAGFSLRYFNDNPKTKYQNNFINKIKFRIGNDSIMRSILLRIPILKVYFQYYRNLSLIICQKT
jgi:hypothetical protein